MGEYIEEWELSPESQRKVDILVARSTISSYGLANWRKWRRVTNPDGKLTEAEIFDDPAIQPHSGRACEFLTRLTDKSIAEWVENKRQYKLKYGNNPRRR